MRGHILLVSTKCHPENVGGGIEVGVSAKYLKIQWQEWKEY
jgi:hypothetical protein